MSGGDDVLVSTQVLGWCLRAQNYPMTNHIHICTNEVGHERQHSCYWCGEKWWHDHFDATPDQVKPQQIHGTPRPSPGGSA